MFDQKKSKQKQKTMLTKKYRFIEQNNFKIQNKKRLNKLFKN